MIFLLIIIFFGVIFIFIMGLFVKNMLFVFENIVVFFVVYIDECWLVFYFIGVIIVIRI